MTRPGTHGNDPRREPLDADERALAQRLARLGPHGTPPSAIDARILSAAHAATLAAPRRTRRLPLALGVAASLVLALGLAWQLRIVLEPPQAMESASAVMAASQADDSQAADPASEPSREAAAAAGPAAEEGHARRWEGADRGQAAGTAPSAPPPPGAARRTRSTAGPMAFPSATAPLPSPTAAPPPATTQPAPPPPAPLPPSVPPRPAASPPPPAPAERAAASPAPASPPGTAAAESMGEILPADDAARRQATAPRRLEHDRAAAAHATQAHPAFAEDGGAQHDAQLRQAQLRRIRTLRDAGHTAQARDELDAFLARWPGYPLPDDLQALRR
jgi:hypothetical protein